jgi:predicted CXXCH cytochrome family protein
MHNNLSITLIRQKGSFFYKTSLSYLFLLIGLILLQSTSIAQEKTCLDCHKRTVRKEYLHGPVSTGCETCHKPNGQKHPLEDVSGFEPLEEQPAYCFNCHEEEEKPIAGQKYVHKPIKRGQCLECHEVHSSNDPRFVFTQSPELCYFCHDKLEETITNSTLVHKPVTDEGGCIECHSPHASSQKHLLVENKKLLCLSCHDKTIKTEDREIANIDKILKESKFQHEALDKSCSTCHSPHASNNLFLLKIYFPTGNYAPGTEENYELCFGCHDTDLLLLEKTKYATEFRNGDQNLHFVHVNKEKGRTCLTCHSIHGSSREHLIPETIKFGKWDMPLNFKPLENGGSCASGCHKERKYIRE